MYRSQTTLLCSAFCLVVAMVAVSLNAQETDLTGVKCIVNGKKAASADAFVEFKKGKVYFCCQNCVAAFKKDMKLKEEAKFTTKAHHQLVLTGQYVQSGCPFSGQAFDDNLMTDVGGTKIGFCNEGCFKKVDDLDELSAKAELVFSKEAFKKGFKPKATEVDLTDVKCMMMPNKNVVAKQAVDYRGGKVYFCSGKCAKNFSKNTEKYASQANKQLVQTGQFEQTSCPISGGDVDDEQASDVAGMNVKFCCHRCKGKVDGASSEEQKIDLVFGEKRFDKAFTKK